MFKPRDKVVVKFEGSHIEGYVLQLTKDEKFLYVILQGRTTRPDLVKTSECSLLNPDSEKLLIAPTVAKRKRGRPRKLT